MRWSGGLLSSLNTNLGYATVFHIFAFEVQLNVCRELLMRKYEKVKLHYTPVPTSINQEVIIG